MFPVATVNNSVPVGLGVFSALCSVGNLKKMFEGFLSHKNKEENKNTLLYKSKKL